MPEGQGKGRLQSGEGGAFPAPLGPPPPTARKESFDFSKSQVHVSVNIMFPRDVIFTSVVTIIKQ